MNTSMLPKPHTDAEQVNRPGSHWPEILQAVEDRQHFRSTEFVHLVLMEMSLVCEEIKSASEGLSNKLKPLQAELRALRILAETSRYANDLQPEIDNLNLDSPKFRFVLHKIIATVRECAIKLKDRNFFSPAQIHYDITNLLSHIQMKLREEQWWDNVKRDMKETVDFSENSVWPRQWWDRSDL
jgi:hypothetical protein